MGGMHPNAHHLPALAVILVAAGRGERLGAERPKAFVDLNGSSLLQRCVQTIASIEHQGQLVIVAPEGLAAEALRIAATASSDHWQVSVVAGGRERHESVRNGIAALGEHITTVLVHDAARPLTPASVFEQVIESVFEHGGAVIPAIPVSDTLKRIGQGDAVVGTEDRASLIRAQTPQGFERELLVAAHESAAMLIHEGDTDIPTDDAEVAQRFGATVRWVPGSVRSHKVTSPDDLLLLQGLDRLTGELR